MFIREAIDSDLEDVLAVERAAFGSEEEANLVRDLLGDATARPLLSLLAFENDRAVGHILFTKAHLQPEVPIKVSILAPLAVIPARQNQGIGTQLSQVGLGMLAEAGVDLVFVLGHPNYYPRFGFTPAGVHGFAAPYPIPEDHAPAWMVKEFKPGVMANVQGQVICADMLYKPEYWPQQ